VNKATSSTLTKGLKINKYSSHLKASGNKTRSMASYLNNQNSRLPKVLVCVLYLDNPELKYYHLNLKWYQPFDF
jgi:hypothetical protein